MNEVRLTLETFLLLCKVLIDTEREKERLRKIAVMQNGVIEQLTSPKAKEERWVREYRRNFAQLQAQRIDRAIMEELDPREVRDGKWWPPRGMIP